MTSQKKIDLLKISASDQRGELETQLEGQPREASEQLFPADFAATGPNSSICVGEFRPKRGDGA